jgi:hypothetical protein
LVAASEVDVGVERPVTVAPVIVPPVIVAVEVNAPVRVPPEYVFDVMVWAPPVPTTSPVTP